MNMAFEDREEDASNEAAEQLARKGVKVNNSKSRFARQAPDRQEFRQNAEAAIESDQDRKQRAVVLVNRFWQIIGSTKLAENKGPTEKSVEAQIVRDLALFANEMNNDPQEAEGSGSVAIMTLMLKALMNQRDQQNEMAFKIQKLEQQVTKLSSQGSGS